MLRSLLAEVLQNGQVEEEVVATMVMILALVLVPALVQQRELGQAPKQEDENEQAEQG